MQGLSFTQEGELWSIITGLARHTCHRIKLMVLDAGTPKLNYVGLCILEKEKPHTIIWS